MVATPIGNLADITLRALHVLQIADAIACEDTRHTQALLRSYGLERPGSQLLAVHQHNEQDAAQTVVQRLQAGQRIAYVSDAGTPGVSDPGARLVAAVRAAGLRALPLPGASSVTTALSVAGAVAQGVEASGFVFAGFLPAKPGERAQAVATLAQEPRCVVLLEAPHRIAELAQSLATLGARPVKIRGLEQIEDDVLHVLAHVTGFRQCRRVGYCERNLEKPCQCLRKQRLARAGGAEQHDVGLLYFDLVRLPAHARFDTFVMIVHGN